MTSKVSKIITIIIIVCIFLILVLKQNTDTFDNISGLNSFYSGIYPDNNLYPLAYQMYQKSMPSMQPQGPLGAQQIPASLGWPESSFKNNSSTVTTSMGALNQQPLTYKSQLYPKIPWYPKINTPCTEGQCGATGTCVSGVCKANMTDKTVFGTKI